MRNARRWLAGAGCCLMLNTAVFAGYFNYTDLFQQADVQIRLRGTGIAENIFTVSVHADDSAEFSCFGKGVDVGENTCVNFVCRQHIRSFGKYRQPCQRGGDSKAEGWSEIAVAFRRMFFAMPLP